MPYTRNTRIKVTTYKHKTSYTAQVEYKYPIIGKTVWENFSDVDVGFFNVMFCKDSSGWPLPWLAERNCHQNKELEEVRGLDWAKAIIDQYHKLFDEKEYKPSVDYIKYPD